jgi:predicted 3-demethylubiquinone-9 3-methyltransferase (glyoxalase superfamily)
MVVESLGGSVRYRVPAIRIGVSAVFRRLFGPVVDLLGSRSTKCWRQEQIAQNQRRTNVTEPAKNTICLWYDRGAVEAAEFYARVFPDSAVGAVHLAPSDNPSCKQGDVLTVDFTVMGIPCIGLNGGPGVTHGWAFSFQVATADQAETDRYWNAIVENGGEESMCGWCKDKWGVNWQITPVALIKASTHADPAVAKRAFDAMMSMKKIDVAAIEAAVRG